MINNKSHSVVFFGAGPYVLSIVDVLRENFDLRLVVTTEKDSKGFVADYCSKNGIELINIRKFDSHNIEKIKGFGVKIAVLASFGLIIPNEVLNLFELGIINIHPSLLPRYRGTTPVQTAILNGDEKTGVSIIKLDDQVDHGPILAQIEEKIEKTGTSESLYKMLFKNGAELLPQVLPKYIESELEPTEQDHSKATFTDSLTRESGFIDINNPPDSEKLDRMIRAYYPWPGVWLKTKLNDVERIIKLLPQNQIQVEGKKVMPLADFVNGYPEGQQILSRLSLS